MEGGGGVEPDCKVKFCMNALFGPLPLKCIGYDSAGECKGWSCVVPPDHFLCNSVKAIYPKEDFPEASG